MNRDKILNPYIGLDGYNCFACAPNNPIGLHLEFSEEGDNIVCVWKPSENFQGWVDTLHGGIQATLLDETCGWVVTRKLQTAGITSSMETQYKHPISIKEPFLTIRAHIKEQRRNLVTIDASIEDSKGNICTHATCVYFVFSQEKAIRELHFRPCLTDRESSDIPHED